MADLQGSAAGDPAATAPAPAQAPIEDIYPLTDMQSALLVRCLSYPDQPVYMGQWWCRVEGEIDAEAFDTAWGAVVQRHTALRSAFNWELKDEPFQVVHRRPAFHVEQLDWSDNDDWRARLNAFLEADRRQTFDLKRPPLMRVRLVRLADKHRLIVWTRHHLVVDGWSLGVILDEVFATYHRVCSGQPIALKPAIPFRAYVDWDRVRDAAVSLAYWKRNLSGLDLPTVPAGKPGSAMDFGELTRTVDADTTAQLVALARDSRITLGTLALGAWILVLSRLTGLDDVVFGAVEAQRSADLLDSMVASLVGPQTVILPVRAKVDDTPLKDWLTQLQASMVAGRKAGAVALDSVRDVLGQPRDAPPFDSYVAVQNYPLDEAGPLAQSGLKVIESTDISLPDLPINLMIEITDVVRFRLIYDRRHYGDARADLILDMLEAVSRAIADRLSDPANTIDALPEAMTRRVLDDFAGNRRLDVAEPIVPQVILDHARQAPDAVAVRQGGRDVTYRELASGAFAIAGQVRAATGGSAARVGIMLDPSPAAIAGLIGIMMAGCAYVPLDPDDSQTRRDLIMATAGIETVVTSPAYAERFAQCETVIADSLEGGVDAEPGWQLPTVDDEAYVIFTSGSTGQPKGVVVGHDNLRFHVAARLAAYPDHPMDGFLLTFPLIFDGSVTVIFWTLAARATLVLPDAAEAKDPDRLAALIQSAGVTHTEMVPSMWGLVVEAARRGQLDTIRLALVAGEACPRALVTAHYAKLPDTPLYNEYGPTETTVWASAHHCLPDDDASTVPIGRPVAGTRVHVADQHGRVCPPETVGELIVSGPSVARGYIGADKATAERFGRSAFATEPTFEPSYHTGDRASFGFDGQLRFHGRVDHQVKVNGNRIELGEIETCLASHPNVKEAAVMVRRTGGQSAQLIAHVAGSDLPEPEFLRGHVRQHLPGYMVPQAVMAHDELPRTIAGKLDRSRLPEPPDETQSAPPQGEREHALASIWEAALGRPGIGRHQDFFDLGGTSLIAMRVISRIRRDLKLNAELLDLFEAPQIALLAQRLETMSPATAGAGGGLKQRQRKQVDLSTVAGLGNEPGAR